MNEPVNARGVDELQMNWKQTVGRCSSRILISKFTLINWIQSTYSSILNQISENNSRRFSEMRFNGQIWDVPTHGQWLLVELFGYSITSSLSNLSKSIFGSFRSSSVCNSTFFLKIYYEILSFWITKKQVNNKWWTMSP